MDDIRLLILLLPLIFLIHDVEEIFAVQEWSHRYQDKFKYLEDNLPWVKRFIQSMNLSSIQFTIAVVFEFSIFLLAAIWASTSMAPGMGMYVFTALMAGLVLHVPVHVIQALVLKVYIPGLVSGVVIVLPFCLYLYQRLVETDLLNWMSIIWTGIVGAILILPIILLAQAAGRKLVRVFTTLSRDVN